jgi:hypothetical protein
MVHQDTAGTLYHAFGKARSPGGEHDKQGPVEAELFKFGFQGCIRRLEVFVVYSIWYSADIGVFFCVRDDDHLFNRRQVFQDSGETLERIEILSLERVSIGCKEHLRLDLTKTVKYPLDAEIR